MTAAKRILGSPAGFTLAELLVTTIISFMLGAGGFLFFRSQVRALTDQSGGLDAIEGARSALDFMASEIRTAGEKPTLTCGANCGLTAASAAALSLGLDANGNGNTSDSGEQIGYSYNSAGKMILRCTGLTCSGGTPLIRNAGSLSLQYVLADGTTTTGPATLSDVVTVIVTVQVQTARATTVTNVTLRSNVTLRNQPSVLAALGAI